MADVRLNVTVRRTMGAAGVPAVANRLRRNADKAAEDFAKNTQRLAKQKVHVITGHLKESIDRYSTGPGQHTVRVNAYYGVYEERGTRYRPPHPFFKPAAEIAKAQFQRDFRKALRK